MAAKNISFVVIDGDLRLNVTKTDKRYIATSLDIHGLNTQGATVEEVIANAHDAAKLLTEIRADMAREIETARKNAAAKTAKTLRRSPSRRVPAGA